MPRRYTLSDEGRARLAESNRRRWADPAFREKHAARMRELYNDPNWSSARSKAVSYTVQKRTPTINAKLSKKQQKLFRKFRFAGIPLDQAVAAALED